MGWLPFSMHRVWMLLAVGVAILGIVLAILHSAAPPAPNPAPPAMATESLTALVEQLDQPAGRLTGPEVREVRERLAAVAASSPDPIGEVRGKATNLLAHLAAVEVLLHASATLENMVDTTRGIASPIPVAYLASGLYRDRRLDAWDAYLNRLVAAPPLPWIEPLIDHLAGRSTFEWPPAFALSGSDLHLARLLGELMRRSPAVAARLETEVLNAARPMAERSVLLGEIASLDQPTFQRIATSLVQAAPPEENAMLEAVMRESIRTGLAQPSLAASWSRLPPADRSEALLAAVSTPPDMAEVEQAYLDQGGADLTVNALAADARLRAHLLHHTEALRRTRTRPRHPAPLAAGAAFYDGLPTLDGPTALHAADLHYLLERSR